MAGLDVAAAEDFDKEHCACFRQDKEKGKAGTLPPPPPIYMPDMEDVWLYPRPPALEPVAKPLRIVFGGHVIAETTAGWRVLETTHPPVYYLPPDAFTGCTIEPASGSSFCEWKGVARYWSLRAGAAFAQRCAWSYHEPVPTYAALRDHLAVYCQAMDQCFVGDEQAVPQPGGFYGGWITSDLKGPFKGVPGSSGW